MFDEPAIYDALVQYITPRSNLHAVSKALNNIYRCSLLLTLYRLKEYNGILSLPAHKSTIHMKTKSIIRKGWFAIDISHFLCFERVVYTEEYLIYSDAFAKMKPSILPCVEQIYIDCHWVGYLTARFTSEHGWVMNPIYPKNQLKKNVPFDPQVYERELEVYLMDWPNLKEVHLFKPWRDSFSIWLYSLTKRIVSNMKANMANPHHLNMIEVYNNSTARSECERVRDSLQFIEHCRCG